MPIDTIIAGLSFFVAGLAFWLSWRSDRRSQNLAKMQAFLELRSRFQQVLGSLPAGYREPGWDVSDEANFEAVMRYWHHAIDEWYITQRLSKRELGAFWDEYFKPATLRGLRRDSLRKTLLKYSEQRPLMPLWETYIREVEQIWKSDHPPGAGPCPGLSCGDHRPPARAE
jgi:hypothetical protein